ncbi:hypothetical protein ABW21_db0207903 [Orbilia brochopaga]|nr:hypothetical protein ABW21_db0207903 [Drechslerella brochopaga]
MVYTNYFHTAGTMFRGYFRQPDTNLDAIASTDRDTSNGHVSQDNHTTDRDTAAAHVHHTAPPIPPRPIFHGDPVTIFLSPDEVDLDGDRWTPRPTRGFAPTSRSNNAPTGSQSNANSAIQQNGTFTPNVPNVQYTSHPDINDTRAAELHRYLLREIDRFEDKLEEYRYQVRITTSFRNLPAAATNGNTGLYDPDHLNNYLTPEPTFFAHITAAMPNAVVDMSRNAHRFFENLLRSKGFMEPSWVELCEHPLDVSPGVCVYFKMHVVIPESPHLEI